MINNHYLVKINSVIVTKGDIENVVNEISDYEEERFDDTFNSVVTSKYFKGDIQKAHAVYFRLAAMATLTRNNDLSMWTILGKDASVSIPTAILSAAASEPLIEIEGRFMFEKESFLQKALELTSPKGSIQ